MSFTIKKNPFQVFVCGTGADWNLIPPDTNATLYCLNDYIKFEQYGVQPDIIFMMDILNEKPQVVEGKDKLESIIDRMNSSGIPLIAPYKYEEIPLSRAFPLKQCVDIFGYPYFTNTICYMIAYAIMAGAREIQLFGINQVGGQEYSEERGGVEYWIGQALGRGIGVAINGNKSQVMKYKGRGKMSLLYGYYQPWEQIEAYAEKFGEQTIKRLLEPPVQYTRGMGPQHRLIK